MQSSFTRKLLPNMTQRLTGILNVAWTRLSSSMLKLTAHSHRSCSAPQRWAAGSYQTRKFLLRQFPFTLIYRERALGDIQVVAVAHTSRKPGYWKQWL
jgi:hypothetical protein